VFFLEKVTHKYLFAPLGWDYFGYALTIEILTVKLGSFSTKLPLTFLLNFTIYFVALIYRPYYNLAAILNVTK
jgi:hypothetical protein